MRRITLLLVALVALPASAQDRLPGTAQHVTVPSEPGQGNKETVVQPSAAIKTGKYGWIQQGERPTTSGAPKVPTRAGRASMQPDLGTSGNAPYVPAPAGQSGPAIVEAAYVSVRGTVTAYTKSAITILEKSGRQRQISLAPRAFVYDGLKPGDEVVLRIPFDEGADCRTADRVERPPAPKAPPKSKFSQAQSTGG
jgi:hypothetical protein